MPPQRTHSRIVIAHHLIFSSYGFWLANDLRGSGSSYLRQPKFEALGPILPGRQLDQPTRSKLRAFYEQATPLLEHTPLWFNESLRNTLATSFAQTTRQLRYTVWAFAVLSNHVHLCLRQHRDHYETIWTHYAHQSRDVASTANDLPANHPLWAARPYSVYLYTPDDIYRTINYINQNPEKENLPPQSYPWIKPYTGWPFPKPQI